MGREGEVLRLGRELALEGKIFKIKKAERIVKILKYSSRLF